MPLHSAGKLGVVLVQLPPFVYPTRGAFGYLKWLAAQLEDYDLTGQWVAHQPAR